MLTKILQPSMAVPLFAPTSNQRVWIFLPVFAITCLASLVYVFARPAVYLSTARLQIEAASSSGRLRTEAASSGRDQQKGATPSQRQYEETALSPQLLAEVQTLTSGALLAQVGERVNQFDPRAGGKISSADVLQGMLSAAPVAGTNVIELRGEGSDRQLLPQILNAWIDVYRQRHGDAFDQFSDLALDETRSVDEQLQQKLTVKRQALDQFRKKFDIVSQERDENQALAQFKGLNTALSEARNREIKAEARFSATRNNVAAGKVVLPSDKTNISNLEQRAADLRSKMKDLEIGYSLKFLEIDPNYKVMRANVTRLEQQIEHERQVGSQHALQDAEEEWMSAQQAARRLQKELEGRKREVQEFTTRFAEHNALMDELRQLEGSAAATRQRLTQLETEKSLTGPKVTILTRPSVPERPLRPDYWRDALLGFVGSAMLGLIAVWFVEFLKRSGVPHVGRLGPATQPIIHINYPPSPLLEVAMPTFGAPVQQLTEITVRLPRELSGPEVRALWSSGSPDARLVIAAGLSGLSIDELAALRYEDINFGDGRICVPPPSARSYRLCEPLKHLLSTRQVARGDPSPLTDTQGGALSSSDLEGLIACAACDAGLANPAEITSEVLRHTYFAYLVRQGVRLADIAEMFGRVAPAAFREYGRLSPPGPGLPLGQIDPVFPALRGLDD